MPPAQPKSVIAALMWYKRILYRKILKIKYRNIMRNEIWHGPPTSTEGYTITEL